MWPLNQHGDTAYSKEHELNTQWIQQAAELEKSAIDFIMVSVLSVKGSTPREIGARMLVTQTQCFGTVGGGHLEWKAMALARDRLQQGKQESITQDYPLGATLGQCCGGFVTLLFESVIQEKFHLIIFGAGHVGKAIVHCLSQIPCQVTWIDSRAAEFPALTASHIHIRHADEPVDEIPDCPANSYYLVLTHNHQLDLALTEAILKRADSSYLGVIGSRTKSARFQHKLRSKGFSDQQIEQMQCPMGEDGIISKQPGEIAISTLAHILKIKQERNAKRATNTPLEVQNEIQD